MGSEDWNRMLNANLSASSLSPRKLRTAVSLAEIGHIYHPRWRLRWCHCAETRACASAAAAKAEWGHDRTTVRPVRLQKVLDRRLWEACPHGANALCAADVTHLEPRLPHAHWEGAAPAGTLLAPSAATELGQLFDDPSSTGVFPDTPERNAVNARNDVISWSTQEMRGEEVQPSMGNVADDIVVTRPGARWGLKRWGGHSVKHGTLEPLRCTPETYAKSYWMSTAHEKIKYLRRSKRNWRRACGISLCHRGMSWYCARYYKVCFKLIVIKIFV